MTVEQHKTALIGIGNIFRQDDGVGSLIAEELKKNPPPGTEIFAHRGDGLALMELWKNYPCVYLFDVVSSGKEPGYIHKFEIPPDDVTANILNCSTHVLSIAECIKLGKALDQIPEKIIVYGIEGKNFAHGEGLSPEVKAAANNVVASVLKDIVE